MELIKLNPNLEWILMTHNDLDGAGGEISFRLHCRGKKHRVIHTSIDEISAKVAAILADPNCTPDKVVLFFADITPLGEVLYELICKGYRIYRFDHHPTAAVIDGVEPESILDTNGVESGTTLLDTFLKNDSFTKNYRPTSKRYEEFVANIRDWDTWAWAKTNDMNAKYLVNLFWLLGYDRFVKLYVDRWLHADASDNLPIIAPDHMIFIEAKLESASRVIEATTPASVVTIDLLGYRAAVLFAGTGFSLSDGSNRFLSKYREYDLMIYFNMAARTAGLRTIRDDLDLGKLVKIFGGGGHPKAAGFSVNYATMMSIINVLIAVPGTKM